MDYSLLEMRGLRVLKRRSVGRLIVISKGGKKEVN